MPLCLSPNEHFHATFLIYLLQLGNFFLVLVLCWEIGTLAGEAIVLLTQGTSLQGLGSQRQALIYYLTEDLLAAEELHWV